jgi:hypothetical protein
MATLPHQSATAPAVPLVFVLVRMDEAGASAWAELTGAAEEIGWPLDTIERLDGFGLLRMLPQGDVPWATWRSLCLRLSKVPGIHDAACIGLDGGAEGYALFRGGRMIGLRSLEWSADETWLRLAEDHETPPEALRRHLSIHGPLGELARRLGVAGREALGVADETGACDHPHHAQAGDVSPEPGPEALGDEIAPVAVSAPLRPGRAGTLASGLTALAVLLLVAVLLLLFLTDG